MLRASPVAELDLSALSAGEYALCVHGVVASRPLPAPFQLLDLAIAPSTATAGPTTLTLSGALFDSWGGVAEAAAIPWGSACASAAVAAPVRAAVGADGTVALDLGQVPARKVRVCVKGGAGPYNVYQDGLEGAVLLVGTFELAQVLYAQDPSIVLEVWQAAVCGGGDAARVVVRRLLGALPRPPLPVCHGTGTALAREAAGAQRCCPKQHLLLHDPRPPTTSACTRCPTTPAPNWNGHPGGGAVLQSPSFFLLRTALKDSPQGPLTANRQPPTATNRQPPTANRQPLFNTVVLCLAHVLTMKQRASP